MRESGAIHAQTWQEWCIKYTYFRSQSVATVQQFSAWFQTRNLVRKRLDPYISLHVNYLTETCANLVTFQHICMHNSIYLWQYYFLGLFHFWKVKILKSILVFTSIPEIADITGYQGKLLNDWILFIDNIQFPAYLSELTESWSHILILVSQKQMFVYWCICNVSPGSMS